MKIIIKIVAISLIALMCSCSYNNKEINISLQKSEIVNLDPHKTIAKIVVNDNRIEKNLGIKEYGKNKITINSSSNLAKIIKKHVFTSTKLNFSNTHFDKLFELNIENLNYNSVRGFPIGNAKSHAKIQVKITDQKNQTSFTKTYELISNQKYLIVSTLKQDNEAIIAMIDDIINEILSDQALQKNLFVSKK